MMKRLCYLFVVVLFVLVTGAFFTGVAAQEEEQPAASEDETELMDDIFDDKESEEQYYQADRVLMTATKRLMDARKAPAINSVITADEIRNMGARTIFDVLRKVPGIGMGHLVEVPGPDSMTEVRGIMTTFSEKVLLLIDGHRMNSAYTGSWMYVFNNLMVEDVERIEVVRGPGSALFGANAFVAVINVITKTAENIDGQQISAGGGDFGTQHYTALFSHKGDRFQISGHADYYDTDGAASFIEEDALKNSGDTLEFAEKWDVGLKMKFGDISLSSRMINNRYGPYIGTGFALNDETVFKFKQFFGNVTYIKDITDAFNINVKLYGDLYDQDAYLEVYPENFTGQGDKGIVGNPMLKNKTLGGEIMASYVLGDHYLTTGFAYEEVEQYDLANVTNSDNFFVEPTPSYIPFNEEITRKIWALYVQNMWEITAYDSLTLGVRHDNYSDFGGTTNPRAGYVHEFQNGLIAKLLYGSAFRAPTFNELYIRNSRIVIGDSELNPEKINTYEVGLEYAFLKHYTLSLSYFHNDIEDLIKVGEKPAPGDPAPWINVDGKTQVDGVEAQLNFYFAKDKYGYINCSYQDGKDEKDKVLAHVPHWKANAGLNYSLFEYLNANLGVSWTGERPRVEGDTRDDLSSQTLVDLTLIAKGFYKGLEIRGSVYNLFDEDYRIPDDSGVLQLIPNDYPTNSRMFLAEVRYKF